MRMIILILFAVSLSYGAASQKYNFQDPRLTDEFGNVYKYLNVQKDIPALTKAQLLATSPQRAGRLYYCTDCTTDALVISTGTAIGAFSRVSARATAIQ